MEERLPLWRAGGAVDNQRTSRAVSQKNGRGGWTGTRVTLTFLAAVLVFERDSRPRQTTPAPLRD